MNAEFLFACLLIFCPWIVVWSLLSSILINARKGLLFPYQIEWLLSNCVQQKAGLIILILRFLMKYKYMYILLRYWFEFVVPGFLLTILILHTYHNQRELKKDLILLMIFPVSILFQAYSAASIKDTVQINFKILVFKERCECFALHSAFHHQCYVSFYCLFFIFVSGCFIFKIDKTDPSCFQPPYIKDNTKFWDPYVTGTENVERRFSYREFGIVNMILFGLAKQSHTISGKMMS